MAVLIPSNSPSILTRAPPLFPGVDSRICLDERLHGIRCLDDIDIAPPGTDDPCRHRRVQVERDCPQPSLHYRPGPCRNPPSGSVRWPDPENGQVGFRIGTDQLCRKGAIVVQGHLELIRELTTWLLVTIYPSWGTTTNPEPSRWICWRCWGKPKRNHLPGIPTIVQLLLAATRLAFVGFEGPDMNNHGHGQSGCLDKILGCSVSPSHVKITY